MRADGGRVGAVEERAVRKDGQGEGVENIPAVAAVEGALHTEAQTAEELGPVRVAGVRRAVDYVAPGAVAVRLHLTLDPVGLVGVPALVRLAPRW